MYMQAVKHSSVSSIFQKLKISVIAFSVFTICTLLCNNLNVRAQGKDGLNRLTNVDSLYTQAQVTLTVGGDIPKALALFNRVVALQPHNASAHGQLSQIYQHQGNYTRALEEIHLALADDANNEDYRSQLGVLQAQTGDYPGAAKVFQSLADSTKDDPAGYYLKAAWAYNMAKDYQKAIAALNKVNIDALGEQREPVLMDKLKIYAHLENVDSVLGLARKLIKLNPENPSYYVIAAFSEEEKKNPQAVIALMDTAVARFPDNPKVLQQAILAYDKYEPRKLEGFYDNLLASETYSDQQKAILFYPLVDIRKKDTLAESILEEKLPKLAFGTPPNKYAIMLYSGVAADKDGLSKGIEILRKGIALYGNDDYLWNELLNFTQKAGSKDSLQKYVDQAKMALPQNAIPYFYQASIDYDKGDLNACIGNLRSADRYNEKDSVVQDFNIYAFLAEVYQEQKIVDSAEIYFKKAIAIYPDAPMVLNNYSYLLAEQGRGLDSALAMSAKSLAAAPEEATFLDTYGWILYKQKRYAEAKTYIEKAIKNTEQPDAAIYEHLGDIENALGNRRQARKNWKKSKSLGNTSEKLEEKLR
ncbi:MAG TPA: tetratricopeptide repeat protein [Edaphocola sp.]|nr:tetratricopeptide repeat protein [Edaphocola sp.]